MGLLEGHLEKEPSERPQLETECLAGWLLGLPAVDYRKAAILNYWAVAEVVEASS